MAKGSRRGGGRKKKDIEGRPAAAKPPQPAPRARGRPAKPKAPVEGRPAQPVSAEAAALPPAARALPAARKVSKRALKLQAELATEPRRRRARRVQTATPSPSGAPVQSDKTQSGHPAFAAEVERRAGESSLPSAMALSELRESVEGGQRELLGRLRAVLTAVETTSTRMAAYARDLSFVKDRLEDVDESLKTLARSLQQPAEPRRRLRDLHDLLREDRSPASPRQQGRKLLKSKRLERVERRQSDPALRSVDKPQKLPGRRGRRSHAAAAPSSTEAEHPNLYSAHKEPSAEGGNSSAAWTGPEPRTETLPTAVFAEETPMAETGTADARPDPPAVASPPPQKSDKEEPSLPRGRQLEFAGEPQPLLAAPPLLPAAESHPRTLFAQQADKRDFF